MILVDANLLLYAYHPRAEQHAASKSWLEAVLAGPGLVRFAWFTLWAFLRISTNPSVFDRPLSTAEAEQAVAAWLAQPVAGIVEPGERHWGILCRPLEEGQASGAIDHGCGSRGPGGGARRDPEHQRSQSRTLTGTAVQEPSLVAVSRAERSFCRELLRAPDGPATPAPQAAGSPASVGRSARA